MLVGRITAWSSFALALVMGGNVLLRYGFNTGSVWSQELEWHLMSPICLFGMSYALRHGEHVRVDVLFASFPQRNKHLVEFITALLSMAISPDRHQAVVGLRRCSPGASARARPIPAAFRRATCSRALIPLGFALLFLQSLAQAIQYFLAWRGERAMPFNEILAILMLVGVLRPAAGGHSGRADAGRPPGLVFGYLGFGPLLFNLLPSRIFGVVTNYTLIAMPLFVFMGVMLEKSKLAEDLMDVIAHAAGNLRGGLGIGIIVVGVLMGATTGIVGATVVTLGLLTLPTLLRRGYDKGLACGTICASGTLGQIIPPSLILILLADILNESVGTLVRRRDDPGPDAGRHLRRLHSRCSASCGPNMVPPVPKEERDLMSRGELCGQAAARRAAADRAGRRGAGLDHRRHRGADRGRLHGRARRHRGDRDRRPHVMVGAARNRPTRPPASPR